MERIALQSLWQELFGQPPHPKLRRQLMVPILCYRAQERTYGGLKASTLEFLQKIAAEAAEQSAKSSIRIKPGTKLLREWHGEFHEVLVTENGYQYHGTEYRTLSEIARVISGAKWSGPLFFGLKKRKASVAK